MGAVIRILSEEISRLTKRRVKLMGQRSESVAPFDAHIAEIDRRLSAARQLLATYGITTADTDVEKADFSREDWPSPQDVAGSEIPSVLGGRRVNPVSKRAKIIRATKTLLEAKNSAKRSEILAFLEDLGIMGQEKDPGRYLSVVLSQAGEIFRSDGTEWYLKSERQA
jgi:hypothetical protein